MSVETDRSRDGAGREGEASETDEPSFCDFRVRSVIILQDKPHDRERLLLKFLKIMKVVRVRSRKSPFVFICIQSWFQSWPSSQGGQQLHQNLLD